VSQLDSLTLFDNLSQISDPRSDHTKRHRLIGILVIAVCAMICGAESWEESAEFGRAKHEWFKQFLELPRPLLVILILHRSSPFAQFCHSNQLKQRLLPKGLP